MLQTSHLPNFVRNQYDVLATQSPETGQTQYLFFWKPPITITRFHKDFWGSEIRTLQKIMAKLGLYRFNVDGIVGQRIIKSVKDFQKNRGLSVTGFPDPETLFLLVNYDKLKDPVHQGNQ